MTRARLIMAVVLAVLTVLALAAPAAANPVTDKLIGCEGKIQWPCPGPVIW